MQFLHIICEGPSEQIFINKLLIPYLYEKHHNCFDGYSISAQLLGKNLHKGGRVNYIRLKDHINRLVKQNQNSIITTFIDFYAIGNDFPSYAKLNSINGAITQAKTLENDLQQIDFRVIPYIQLHEYETIYFADIAGLVATDSKLQAISQEMNEILVNFDNEPELINNSPMTAPSKRIHNIFAKQMLNYQDAKTFYASLYSADGGSFKIDLIRSMCPRFDAWIKQLLLI